MQQPDTEKSKKRKNDQTEPQDDLISALRVSIFCINLNHKAKGIQVMNLISQMEKIQVYDEVALKKHIQTRKDINKVSKVKSLLEKTKNGRYI